MGNSCSNPASGEAPWFDTKEVPQVAEVNVLCFNMFVRPPFINNNGDDYKDERLREFTKMISGYDVICLQEMFGVYSRRREALINEARKVGFLFHAASPRPSTLSSHFIDAGLLVLSRFPITDFEFCPYAMGFGVDYYVQKGILYTKIKIGSASLHLFDTHTQANYEPDISCLLKKTEQFRAFQQFIKTALAKYDYREEDIVLLAGDMNVNARTKVIYQSEAFSSNPLFQGLTLLKNSTTFHEYDAVLGILSDDHKDQLDDLLYLDCGEHPTTFGDSESTLTGDRRPIDTVLTHKNNFCSHQRLDYIFNYIPKTLPENIYRSKGDKIPAIVKLRPKKGSATVEKFFVKGHPFCQLSDHYGVKVTVLCENTLRAENTAQEPLKPMTDYHDKLGYSVKQAQYKDYGL